MIVKIYHNIRHSLNKKTIINLIDNSLKRQESQKEINLNNWSLIMKINKLNKSAKYIMEIKMIL